MTPVEKELCKYRILGVLPDHIGREKAIGMGELYEVIFGKPWANRINDTRMLRQLITELRREGSPICSTRDQQKPGYYFAPRRSSEGRDYVARLKREALRKLDMAARFERIALPELMGQMVLNLRGEAEAKAEA